MPAASTNSIIKVDSDFWLRLYNVFIVCILVLAALFSDGEIP
jgi:hypothetical protein